MSFVKFGECLKQFRKKRGFKLSQAAQMLDISTSYLSSMESGARPAPYFEKLQQIADTLELTNRERYLLYDLAAESKQPPTLSEDLNKYIYQNLVIRDLLRYAMECQLSEKEWNVILSFVKKYYYF